jgi:hypothetical protein
MDDCGLEVVRACAEMERLGDVLEDDGWPDGLRLRHEASLAPRLLPVQTPFQD